MVKKWKNILLLLLIPVLAISAIGLYQVLTFKSKGSPTLDLQQVRNADTARQWGIQGYIEITVDPKTPESYVLIRDKDEVITLYLHFVSHTNDLTTTEVTIDAKSEKGIEIEVFLGDDKGSVKLSDYVSYNPRGTVKIKAGQTVKVEMTVNVPKDVPSVTIPLRAVGIYSKVPIIHDYEVKLNV